MAWECTQCGFTIESNTPPMECPECGADQEMLMWVQDAETDTEEDVYDENDDFIEGLQEDVEKEDSEDDDEEHVPELGEEFGVFFEPDDSPEEE
ncbi:MAG: hypothetical protein GXP49_12215 [Deltaproteobacteria bacterium]|nr:hypothetical protein [Deltaproteobacteria bacterium]